MGSTSTGSLKRNTLSVGTSVVMCMAFMGPATSVAFNTAPAAGGAGRALPFALVLALVACLLVANTIAAYARKLPTAGFAYTYNTHGFGPSGGFLSGWLLLLAYGMVGPMLFAAIGAFGSDFVKAQFGWHIAWEIITVLFVLIVWAINASGVSQSARAAMVFLVLEVGVMLGLASTILGKGGAHGVSLSGFNPAQSLHGISGLSTGMLWGILMFIGFESVATLGEEAKSARRTVPAALFSAVIVIGLFYVYTAFASSNGFDSGRAFAGDASPWSTLAQRFWGGTAVLTLTVMASQFANVISGSNAIVRVIFSMGRESILPSALGRTDRRNTPVVALGAYMLFSLAFTLLLGLKYGPYGVYGFAGTVLGLGMVVIYLVISLGVIRFYRLRHRAEFSLVRHGILPAVTAVLMLLPIYGQLHPTPAYPNNWAIWLLVAWMVVGGAYLVVLRRRRPELIGAMGTVFEGDAPDSPAAEPEPVPAA
ncbi:MAG: family permease [Mycobacterium sp.]|jgi:amino acid transporter|nr:family permease [Mycobacterium sp.]